MRTFVVAAAVGLCSVACNFPATRMEPAADYAAGHVTISGAPSYTAGTNYVTTTSPDGATRFVCVNGGSVPGNVVPPHSEPAC
jgi:hypothetical protein